MSRSHEVKMYPTEPLSDGIAFMEYDVLKSGFGELDIERCNPRGMLKSSMAVPEALGHRAGHAGETYHLKTGSNSHRDYLRSNLSPCSNFARHKTRMDAFRAREERNDLTRWMATVKNKSQLVRYDGRRSI